MADLRDELVGAEVSSVEFVRDYVQLHLQTETDEHTPFGNRVRDIHISAITDPQVKASDTAYRHGDPGWRDALCALINRTVEEVTLNDNELAISFEGGFTFVVSLADEDRVGPEAVVVNGLGAWVY